MVFLPIPWLPLSPRARGTESVHVVVRLCQVAPERVEGHLRRLREECWYWTGYEVSIPHGTFQLPLGQLDGGDVVPVLYVINFISVLNICLNIYIVIQSPFCLICHYKILSVKMFPFKISSRPPPPPFTNSFASYTI